MISLNHLSIRSSRFSVQIFVIAWIVSGCSSSNDSISNEATLSADSINIMDINESDNDISNEFSDDVEIESVTELGNDFNSNGVNDNTPDSGQNEDTNTGIANDTNSQIEADSSTTDQGESEFDNVVLVVQDPLPQFATQVNFVITVPAYQSNALQVELTWGGINATAAWVGDELWSVSLNFPSNTEQLLTVIFSDNFGNLVLSSYEQIYRTGFNDSESLQITADQFDTDRWDLDEDNESNLAELIAGTDPLQNETVELEVRDSYLLTSVTLVSAYHEQSISSERPFSFSLVELPPVNATFNEVRQTHIVSIEIDETGNGVFSDNFEFREPNDVDITTENQEATRAKTENSVVWEGTYSRSNSSSQVSENIDFSIETQSINDQTSKQDGSVQRILQGRGALDFEQDLSYSLLGEALDDSLNCTPSSGTVTNRITNTRSFPVSGHITIVSKESDDILWSVRVTDLEGEFIEEYLARSLVANFYCDFSDM